jgi:meiosis induction protein kinase IME2/SME1
MKKNFESFAPCLELREVVFLRTLPTHPHLVPALDIFLDPFSKKLHICMEYMDGNLYQLMKARDHKCLDVASVKSILFQIMQGLEHIHAHHFFHRDIKPENILVSTSAQQESGNSFRRYSAMVTPPSTPPTYTVKIADFGLARETHSKLAYTTYVSTRWYRAPEVLLRAGEYSSPVDIWAIGAMAVEIATLKPLFPGGNEVDQVWRVCEIMGSPGNWYNKAGAKVGGGDWREGTRLAGKLGFSFPKMAPHSMDTILQTPQWPASLSNFVTWCLMWDPKTRPTSTQALAHEFFTDAVDPLRPKSSASKMLGRKHSDLSYRGSKDLTEITPTSSSKSSWFRKSLIGRSDSTAGLTQTQAAGKENIAPRPSPVHAATDIPVAKTRPQPGKRSTWTNGPSNAAPMPILPTIKPISPLSDAVTAQASSRTPSYSDGYSVAGQRPANMDEKVAKKIGRQLSVASNSNHYADIHRQQAEMALNGNTGLASPPNGQKESFFSHLRKRARRFSGRQSQTPISPKSMDIEAQAGCGPWASNRSSMILDGTQLPSPVQKVETYEALDKALRNVQQNLDSSHQSGNAPPPPSHLINPSSVLKRHHSLPQQQPRSVDNLRGPGPISSRTRRSGAPGGARQYETPDEEEELLDEVLSTTHKAMKRMDRNSIQNDSRQPLRQSTSNLALSNPYPTPSPSASGNAVLFGQGLAHVTPSKAPSGNKQSSTPPYDYEENEWAASAAASIFAASSRF